MGENSIVAGQMLWRVVVVDSNVRPPVDSYSEFPSLESAVDHVRNMLPLRHRGARIVCPDGTTLYQPEIEELCRKADGKTGSQ
jgi:hypothetical protein